MQNLVFILVFIACILTGNAAVAFGPPNGNGNVPLGNCSVRWVVIDDNGNTYRSANLRIQSQNQKIYANGKRWIRGKVRPGQASNQIPITVSDLELCLGTGITVSNLQQNGANGNSFADDQRMYISFDATDNGNGQTTSYDYRLEHPSTFTYDINTAPTANAGSDAAVTSGTQVKLTGSGTDTDGTIASYQWTRTGGTGNAANATLSDATAADPTFTDSSLTSNDSLVTHIFELVVTDDDGAASSAVTITINPPDVTPPDPPKAENTAVVRNQDDSITVSGTGAEPGATVKVIFPDGSVGSTVVKTQLVSLGGNSFSITESSGTYSVTSGPEQPSGTVRVVLVDAAGNASDALVHNIDTTAPDAPTAQNTTVTVNADSSVTVSGTDAEVDATARVTFPDGSVVEATVAGDGTYSVTSGPEQPSGTVKVVLLDAAGNASDALELRFVGVPTVAQIQTEIATYMQTRAGFVLAAQPDLIGFLSGNVTGALNAFVTKRNGTFNFATSGDDFGSPKKLPFWVRMQGNWSDNGQHKNSYYFGAVGAHRFLSPNAIAGLTLQYDRLKQQDGNTTTKGVGYLVGPYIIAKFPEQPLYFEGRYLFGKTDNSVSIDGGPPQNFKTDLSLLSFKIAGKLHYGDFTLTPSLTATHLEDKQDAFIDNYGRSVAEQGISMTDVALGLDFAKTLDVSNGRLLLTGGIAGVWSDTDGSGFASTITPKFDGQRARIRLGATYSLDGGMALSVGVNYDGIGVDNYESFSISFGLNAEF
jgi:hypothetical protein